MSHYVPPIYLDIETVPDQSPGARAEVAKTITPPSNYSKADTIAKWEEETKPGLVEAAWLKTSFDGAAGQIAVASIAIGDAAPVSFWAEDWRNAERDILRGLFAAIEAADLGRELAGGTRAHAAPQFIGHYIVDFDLRFLFQRAVMLGVKPPACIPFHAKPWGHEVYDTMVAWAGAKGRISLDRLCRALGLPAKGAELGGEEVDGSKVWGMVRDGRIADVAIYCEGDVERVRQAHRRMTFQG